ncbi:hypothetical protein [Chitinophaga pinensis]|uniref:Uncharacterized protein n=1 Tax=Chitinophaga pinensis TaxID=79329 RepID=A0A5C6LPC0_9BACT|nr:hypothetical protein [Chitinophaga pinensis]TWV98010.1 hypothetical protein FEF09_20795 [Chitinophaga pinensis]
MRKCVLLAIICILLLPVMTKAQEPAVTRSAAFNDPEYGSGRLLLAGNGNTLYFQFTRRKGIAVTVYDAQRQAAPVVYNAVRSWNNWHMDEASLKGVFEMNGQAVVFMEKEVKRDLNLYRFIFDIHSGKLMREDLVESVHMKGLILLPTGEFLSKFYIRKDPVSEYYAIAICNERRGPEGQRIKVTHYTPAHQVINTGEYISTADIHQHVVFLDMYVNSNRFVSLASYHYRENAVSVKNAEIRLSSLLQGTPVFRHQALDSTGDYRDVRAALKYNSEEGNLYLLTGVHAKSVRENIIMQQSQFAFDYALQMTIFDPLSLQIRRQYFVKHPQLNDYVKDHLKYKNPYYGLIQDFYVNPDKSVHLLFEEIYITQDVMSSIDSSLAGITGKKYSTRLGEIAVVKLDSSGQEINSYAIAKAQQAGVKIGMYYQNRGAVGKLNFLDRRPSYSRIPGFFSYQYLPANGAIIYNDYAVNTDSREEDYRTKKDVYFISDANTVLATYDGKDIRKTYLFGAPSGDKEARFTELGISTYSGDGKQYATMMVERKGRHMNAYIVWMNL